MRAWLGPAAVFTTHNLEYPGAYMGKMELDYDPFIEYLFKHGVLGIHRTRTISG